MSVLVDKERCNGCGKLEEPLCVMVCPGDLMAISEEVGGRKALHREPWNCWDCMACVKACPRGAVQTRLPFVLSDFGATLRPTVHKDRIDWTLTDPDGKVEEFTVRTLEA